MFRLARDRRQRKTPAESQTARCPRRSRRKARVAPKPQRPGDWWRWARSSSRCRSPGWRRTSRRCRGSRRRLWAARSSERQTVRPPSPTVVGFPFLPACFLHESPTAEDCVDNSRTLNRRTSYHLSSDHLSRKIYCPRGGIADLETERLSSGKSGHDDATGVYPRDSRSPEL